jgi:hypothetical protein
MDLSTRILACASLAVIALSSISPAMADSKEQKAKNTDRNVAIGAGAVGLYGLTHHNPVLAVAGIAGAAYAGKKYEDTRKEQSKHHRRRHSAAWYREHHRNY